MQYTIADNARATEPRREGKAAFNADGHRLVKRHHTPGPIAHGTVIIEQTGAYMKRTEAGWVMIVPETGRTIGEPVGTLDLMFPVVEVALKSNEHHQSRAERRTVERNARTESKKLARFKRRRVAEFLAACSPDEREKYAHALGDQA